MHCRLFAAIASIGLSVSGAPPLTAAQPRPSYEPLDQAGPETLARIQQLHRDYRNIESELNCRRARRRFRTQFRDPDTTYLRRTLVPVEARVWERVPTDDLIIRQREIEIIVERDYLTYGDRSTRFLVLEGSEPIPIHIGGVPFVSQADIQAGRSVVAIIQRSAFDTSSFPYQLKTEPLLDVANYHLCDSDPFFELPTAAMDGTGFLMEGGRVVTTGHSVAENSGWLDSVFFVFDYAWKADGTVNTTFSEDQVFIGESIVARFHENPSNQNLGTHSDWAIIQLTTVPDRPPLAYREHGQIERGSTVFMIGHPFGLPQTLSQDAEVLDASNCRRFKTSLDNYPYNSGSPVFLTGSSVVEGVLAYDLGQNLSCGACRLPASYTPEYGWAGADVTRSTEFAEWLKHPKTVRVRTRVPSAEILAQGGPYLISLAATSLSGDAPDFVDIPASPHPTTGNWEAELELNAPTGGALVCSPVSVANAGELWEVVEDTEGYLTLRRVCFP